MLSTPARGGFQTCGEILLLAGIVFLLEELMHHIGFFNHVWQAIWWPTNGLALALMVRAERRRWPILLGGVLLGSLMGEFHYHAGLRDDFVNMIANSVGPLTGALALPRCRKLDDWLQEPHLVPRFVLLALGLGPLLSATIFASYMHFAFPGQNFWTLLQIRADSDMLGYAMFTPLVLVLTSREKYRMASASEIAMVAGLLAIVAATTAAVFAQSAYSLGFVLISLILMVCQRLGFSTSILAVNLMAFLATSATMHGHGPLTLGGGSDPPHRILLLQAFLAVTMITVFSASVVQIEREVFQGQLQIAYREMEKLASTDPLTGLGNRRLFEENLRAEWGRARRSGLAVSLLMIDVDHFKAYNDRFGHPAGDVCLCAIAKAILSMDHRSSDLLARYGGEEFIFLLPETPAPQAAAIAASIRAMIETLHDQPGANILSAVTVSIGCASFAPAPGLFADLLVSAADEALYRAKRNGRNRVEFAEVPTPPFPLAAAAPAEKA